MTLHSTTGTLSDRVLQLQHTFELMEASFIVDADGHPFLLSIVSGTCANAIKGPHSSFRDNILARIMEEMLQLCLDPIFPLNGENCRRTRIAARKQTSGRNEKALSRPPIVLCCDNLAPWSTWLQRRASGERRRPRKLRW